MMKNPKRKPSARPRAQSDPKRSAPRQRRAPAGRRSLSKSGSGAAEPRPRPMGATQTHRTPASRSSRRARLKPIVRGESETLLQLEDLLSRRIVGKEEAIRRVADTIRVRRANLDFRPTRPDGSFLLVGPPGVGKTEFACAVAEVLLGGDQRVLLLDMADYSEEEDFEELLVIPHPEHDDLLVQGALTTPVRTNPRSVILFRGIEKAHPTVQRMLLHILDRGEVTDAQGTVRFNESIIFATTQLVPQEFDAVGQIGFMRVATPHAERWRKFLEDQLSQDLVSAFNEILFFERLTLNEVKLIARYKVNAVLERLRRQKRGIEVSENVFETFIRDEDVRRTGARDLNRTLEEKIFTPLSKYLLTHADVRDIRVDVRAGRVVILEKDKR